MANQFIDPIALSFDLLQNYRALLDETLRNNELSDEDVAAILANIEVDKGLYISINRKYREGTTGFRQFCEDHNLSHRLPDMLHQLKRLYIHQEKAIEAIRTGQPTVISTGTGSGKTESFLIPILDHCLKHPSLGVKALIIYPMNALAGDQMRRLADYTGNLRGHDRAITFGSFIGTTSYSERHKILQNPPDILITNYVMLDWMLTSPRTSELFSGSADSLSFIVIDEIHSYRGNKATHLKYLLRRLKSLLNLAKLVPVQIGTSATLADKRGSSGYLGTESGERLDQFIKLLLDVDTYEFITPEFEDEPDLAEVHPVNKSIAPDWTLNLITTVGASCSRN